MRGSETGPVDINVEVARRALVAEGVVHLVLRRPDGDSFPGWDPGAHIDLELKDGLVRQYSLCGDPAERDVIEIAVLREPDGRGGSAYVHDNLTEGTRVVVRGPRNNFAFVDAPSYVFIAGGIGITPLLPMMAQATRTGRSWQLVYGGRSRTSMAFVDELVRSYGDRVSIRPQNETGLLDLDSILRAHQDGQAIYCCGPETLLRAVEERTTGWPPGVLHVERFSPKDVGAESPSTEFEVELVSTGQTVTVPEDKSIVDALEDAGIEVMVSCQEGTCGTCETAVVEGEPDHRDSILTDDEKARNDTMFICVSRSRSARLRLDL